VLVLEKKMSGLWKSMNHRPYLSAKSQSYNQFNRLYSS